MYSYTSLKNTNDTNYNDLNTKLGQYLVVPTNETLKHYYVNFAFNAHFLVRILSRSSHLSLSC